MRHCGDSVPCAHREGRSDWRPGRSELPAPPASQGTTGPWVFGTPALKIHVPNFQRFLTLNSSEQKVLAVLPLWLGCKIQKEGEETESKWTAHIM